MANEKRLIDANALQLAPDPWGGMNGVLIVGRISGRIMATVQAALKRMIDNAPTVDAVEVVHGYNTKQEFCWDDAFECSVCGYEDWDCMTCEPKHHNYCPNCGAKMDAERKEKA